MQDAAGMQDGRHASVGGREVASRQTPITTVPLVYKFQTFKKEIWEPFFCFDRNSHEYFAGDRGDGGGCGQAFLAYLVGKDLHCFFGGSNGLAFWQITQSIRGLFLKECLCWYLCLTKVPLYRSSLVYRAVSPCKLQNFFCFALVSLALPELL